MRSASRCCSYATGRVACCASPRTAFAYSIPPIAFDVPLRANRWKKYSGTNRSWSSVIGSPGRMLRSPKLLIATRRTAV